MNKTNQQSLSLDALRAGDRAEYARLVENYYQFVYRLALKMLGNPQDAEDILQDTFIKVFRHLDTFDGRSNLSTWIYRIAVNEALMFLRKKQPELVSIDQPVETDEGEQDPVQIVDWCCLPENELMSSEAKAHLDQAMSSLPPGLRAVFILRDIQGLSTRETSEVLNISEMAVKTRLSRARLRLRELLTEYFGERLVERKSPS
ncbi:MAG: sigma-70 family RNA polymerase sigma factor [Chloroflexi bacterium]|nr:sigma-70 family RNA polymerase sigma factor [Chloroflexota bacterium]